MKKLLKVSLVSLLTVMLLAACSSKEEPKTEKESEVKKEAKKDPSEKPPGYEEHSEQVKQMEEKFAKYKDVKEAVKDGYTPTSGFVPMMGYHFQNLNITEISPENPNTLLYVIDENGDFKLVGVEWAKAGGEKPSQALFNGTEWKVGHEASAHYDDGTEIPAKSADVAPKINPETGAKFTLWHPDIWGIHMYLYTENPDGLFADFNPALAKYNNSPAMPPLSDLKVVAPSKGE